MKIQVKCLCGDVIKRSDLISHISECEQFTEKYSFFNDAIRKAVQSCENKLEQSLLLSLIYVAKQSLAKMNVEEGHIPSLHDQVFNQIHNIPKIENQYSPSSVKSEIKIKEEIKKQNPMEQYFDDNTIKCVKCDTIFLDLSMIHYLDKCLHIICTQCLKKIVFDELPKKDTVACPLCKADLREIEYKV